MIDAAKPEPRQPGRCADCLREIDEWGNGHLSWCPFDGYEDFPRLAKRPAVAPVVRGLEASSDLRAVSDERMRGARRLLDGGGK